jgi:1-acyl-sn-glycerol-3-phosphate acyltransferase
LFFACAVPIDRTRGSFGGLKTTLKLLQEEEAVLVFPEGSRTYDGKLQPLKSGFCLLARRSGVTIVPVAIQGAFAAMPRGSTLPHAHPITLAFSTPITSTDYLQLADAQLVQLVEAYIAQHIAIERTSLFLATESREQDLAGRCSTRFPNSALPPTPSNCRAQPTRTRHHREA